jgi:predicted O-methyltransferase YrrM
VAVEMLEGDLRETLRGAALDTVDFVLLDGESGALSLASCAGSYCAGPLARPLAPLALTPVWTPMALPALQLVQPHLRPGATIVADNTTVQADGYAELMAHADEHGYQRLSLPYAGGLTLMTYYPEAE